MNTYVPKNGISGTYTNTYVPKNGKSGTYTNIYVPKNGKSGTYKTFLQIFHSLRGKSNFILSCIQLFGYTLKTKVYTF